MFYCRASLLVSLVSMPRGCSALASTHHHRSDLASCLGSATTGKCIWTWMTACRSVTCLRKDARVASGMGARSTAGCKSSRHQIQISQLVLLVLRSCDITGWLSSSSSTAAVVDFASVLPQQCTDRFMIQRTPTRKQIWEGHLPLPMVGRWWVSLNCNSNQTNENFSSA